MLTCAVWPSWRFFTKHRFRRPLGPTFLQWPRAAQQGVTDCAPPAPACIREQYSGNERSTAIFSSSVPPGWASRLLGNAFNLCTPSIFPLLLGFCDHGLRILKLKIASKGGPESPPKRAEIYFKRREYAPSLNFQSAPPHAPTS